jgi:hypothetical protein
LATDIGTVEVYFQGEPIYGGHAHPSGHGSRAYSSWDEIVADKGRIMKAAEELASKLRE